jgi:PAS domain S-box-containing protein
MGRMDMPSAPGADFTTLFHFLPIGAYRSSAEGRMIHANEQLARINGFRDVEELLDRARHDPDGWYVDPARRHEFQLRLARDGEVRGFISEVKRRHDSERMWVSENAHMVRDAEGRVLFYEGTVEDITERVAQQKAMREQQERMQALADQIPGVVFSLLVRPDGTRAYRFVSSGVREMYGFSPEDLLRDPMLIARYRHPEDIGRLDGETEAIHAGKVELAGEFRIVLPDGQVKWIYKRSCEVLRDSEGVHRVGVLLDISARKKAEDALRESEALWKLALESAGEGVWDWNLVTGEEYLSDSLLSMYGYTRDEVRGVAEDLDARTHPDDIPAMLEARQAHFEGRARLYRNEHRVRAKDGRWLWILTRGMVISRDESGRPTRIVGTHTDITDLKQAEEQQRELEGQLRESQKMEAIGTLAGGVAHDFNNLLAAILGNLVLAREDVGAEHPAQESLAEINRAAIRARQLVQQILTFSRRGAQVMEHQPLLPLVEEALGLMRSLLPAGVRLLTRLSKEPLPALVDATQMQQVLMNLCTNAWQAFAGRSGEVTVALERVALDAAQALQLGALEPGTYARLSVADNGPGMDEVTQRRVFEPFFTTKAPGTGTGLGLAVVHGIVKAHRGAISLTSQPGAGTRFDVYLPLAASAAAPLPDLAVMPPPAPPAAPEGRHVVYIDDYEALVFLVGRLLRKQGYRVSTFESGEAALAWFSQHPREPVDLLVTDQNMPGMAGVEVVRELRRLRPALRMAIVSGHVSDTLIAEAASAGVDDVLAKQDSMDALGAAIRGLLEPAAGTAPAV